MTAEKLYKLGDIVRKPVSFGTGFDADNKNAVCADGTVIYVHPKRRFYTLEFSFGFSRKFCESYSLR